MHLPGKHFNWVVAVTLLILSGCSTSYFDTQEMKEHAEQLKKTSSFQFPVDDFFPEIPVTLSDPPEREKYHTAEDCFVPAGTPVYAIGDGTVLLQI